MPIRIDISDNDLAYFTNEAKEELKHQLELYSTEIIKESGRLEESFRDDSTTPEITRTIVKKAVTKYRDIFGVKKRTKTSVLIKIIATIFIFLAGLLFDYDKIQTNSLILVIFLIAVTVAIISTTLMFIWEGDNR